MMPRLRARWFVSRCVLGKRLHRFLRNYEGQPRGTRQRKYINTPRAGPPKNGGPFLFVRLFRKAKAEVLPVKPPPPLFFRGECVHVEEAIGVERRTYFFFVVVVGKPNCPSTENYQKKTVATCSCDFGFSVWCTGNRRKTVFVSGGGER